MNPEFTSFITRGGYHPSFSGVSYGQRLPPVLGMITLFY
jgi:hypothetical protein